MGVDRRSFVVGGVALAAVAFGGWLSLRKRFGDEAADARTIAELLALTLPDPAGQPVALSTWRGRTLVLNFWATWCPPCVEEMPELSAMHAELAAAGAQVLGIGVDTQANVAQFARQNQIAYPLLVTGAAGIEWARRLGDHAGALPYTVVVAPDGRVVDRTLGRIKAGALRTLALQTAQATRS